MITKEQLVTKFGTAADGRTPPAWAAERLDRDQRLAALKFVADRDGADSQLYHSLAAQHQYLLSRFSGQMQRVRQHSHAAAS